jgi:8-oxo-dGTP diphosphatase
MTVPGSDVPDCLTPQGRPAFVVNVEVFLHRGDRWLLIRRSEHEAHAAGTLGGVGGKVDAVATTTGLGAGVLEATGRREVAEEIGVDLTGVDLSYVDSASFVTDDGDPVINVVFSGPLPPEAEPFAASTQEVAGLPGSLSPRPRRIRTARRGRYVASARRHRDRSHLTRNLPR